MEKVLYIECNMGIAGDMLMGALLDMTEDKDAFIETMNNAGIPNTEISYKEDVKCGITGTHVSVVVSGKEEASLDVHEHNHDHGHEHDHEHCHDHSHEHSHTHDHDHEHSHEHSHAHENHHDHKHNHDHPHHHTSLNELYELIDNMNLPETVKEKVRTVYGFIAEAESKVHGKSVSKIHLHEVGMCDALADITGCCLLIEQINPDKVVVSPIKTGFGQVKCAHGIVPVPAPAAAHILKGIPNSAGSIQGELCTPTGAALAKAFATDFGYQPEMITEAVGYGTGNKDFESANCVRVVLGNIGSEDKDSIVELKCNIDDMTGEEMGFAVERLIAGKAVDVFTTPIFMKKNRPGILLTVLCKESDKENVVKEIFKHTTTIGIRESLCNRYVLNRELMDVKSQYGKVKVKKSSGYETDRYKIEYSSLKDIAISEKKSLIAIEKEIEKNI